jgi:protein-tyrosine-phosphatase
MESHKSRTVSEEDMERADLVLVPDRHVFNKLVEYFPKQRSKIELYLRLVGVDAEIANCGKSDDADLHRMVAEMVLRTIEAAFETIVSRARAQVNEK